MYSNLTKTFVAGEALERYRLVKISAANTVVYADAADFATFVTTHAAASGESVNCVALCGAAGTFKVVASEAITIGAKLAAAADGKVQTGVSTEHVFCVAVEAAAADGDEIEAVGIPGYVLA